MVQKAELLSRSIYPNDYKRRSHYYLDVDMKNAEAEVGAKPPVSENATDKKP